MANPLDIVDVLSQDHAELSRLLDRLDDARRAEDLHQSFLEIARLFGAHEVAEQEVVYPALVVARPGILADSEGRLAEHQEVNELMAAMHGLDPAGAGFEKRAGALAIELRAHFTAEEESVFPVLREAFDPAQLAELGRKVEEAKSRAPAPNG